MGRSLIRDGVVTTLALAAVMFEEAAFAKPQKFAATEQSLARHVAPEWFHDAKLGIFIHWGLYSVPAYAPREARTFGSEPTRMSHNPYAEWYHNTLLLKGSPTEQFHKNAYGANFNYYDFANTFKAASKDWSPDDWAILFSRIGARYVVLTTKHHDGFTLWPSALVNPNLPSGNARSDRDLVGELTTAVRAHGMKMGYYYSSLLDWSWKPGPIGDPRRADDTREQSPQYVAYADAQWRELIARYKPDILWSDIGYPASGSALQIAADYYNAFPQGVINNRFGPFKIGDFTTPEYKTLDHISEQPWETCRGLGKSFGLNRIEGPEETITPGDLVHLLVDIVSKNGNLLLDVGPEPDGTIPAIQTERLNQLGGWLQQNGEAIFGTRPWTRFDGKTSDGGDVRFTARGKTLYAVLLAKPAGRSATLINVPGYRKATLLGGGDLAITPSGNDLTIALPSSLAGDYAWVIRLQ